MKVAIKSMQISECGCYCKNFIHKTGGGLDLAKFAPLLEPSHMKSQLIGKDPDTGKD